MMITGFLINFIFLFSIQTGVETLENKFLVPDKKEIVFRESFIHKINKLNDNEKQRKSKSQIAITNNDPSIIEIEITIK